MRILQIITLSELGGAQSVVVNLANGLCKNHEVIVAAGEGDGKMFDLLDVNVIREHIPALQRSISPLNELKAIFQLQKLYKKYKPDIIHLHSSKAGLLGRIAFPKLKIIYTVHGFDSIRLAYRKFLPLEKILQHRCAAIVGVSKYDEAGLLAEGINNNVKYIYNGIAKPKRLDFNPFESFSNFKKKVLCIARFSPQKNVNLFISVAKLLPEYAFLWIGNQINPEFDYPPNVFFIGNIKSAGSYIEHADLFFLPSNYEGLPIVIIESLASGVPVVASDVGGVTELLNGKNGIALTNDANEMANRINKILSMSISERQLLEKEAKSTYLRDFTIDNMVDNYLKLYQTII